ncbi:MAG TPA: M1 family aminopeptidase [Candidatus Limnocylindrales bacterium]
MIRRSTVLLVAILCAALLPGAALASHSKYTPGAPGIGDPYYPTDGNGGYDVSHYGLDVRYDPATDQLTGIATIKAKATQNLSAFNLDLSGLTIRSVKVNGKTAAWSRAEDELTVTPRRGLDKHKRFTVRIRYDGVPETIEDIFGLSGFIHTDDGALVIGQPHVADTWFPANDHPIDKAAFTYRITVPRGLEAVANGRLVDKDRHGGWTTWTWDAKEPMTTYLAGMSIGQLELDAYKRRGIRYWDAIDPVLLTPVASPRTGTQFAISQQGEPAFKRLVHVVDVPAGGAQLSFWVNRMTELDWDHVFVEVHTIGADDWTTLKDLNGHNAQFVGNSCPYWLSLHPFLTHYQTELPDADPNDDIGPSCDPSGTTGEWWAASGDSPGYEQWAVDLGAYKNKQVEVSISYASDDSVQGAGVFVDDIVVSTGQGTTSFEDDGNSLDGWTVPGAPADSVIPNPNDWIVGTVADTPPTLGQIAQGSFARQPEIIRFEEKYFGSYPFSTAGGIVDSAPIGFALENQTRPIYSQYFFFDPIGGDDVIVHELAHQWYGDSLAVDRWKEIWLNEGFATYAEWLWFEAEGLGTAQDNYDFWTQVIPSDDEFWALVIGDPGPEHLFDFQVYVRGALTLHALRLEVGDKDFFKILKRWSTSNRGRNVNTAQFIRLAERISGEDLDELFDAWLYTGTKPVPDAPPEEPEQRSMAGARALALDLRHAPMATRTIVQRLRLEGKSIPGD